MEWYLNSMYLINFAIVIAISYAIGRWDGKRKEAKRIAKRFAKVNASLTYVQRKKSKEPLAWPKISDILTIFVGLVVVGAILVVSLVIYEI